MPMSIQNNIAGINANRSVSLSQRNMADALQRLSSGLRVNRAQDGPAALIISELLRSQSGGIERAIRNTQEANNVLSIAEGGMSEISNQLSKMRQLAVHALNSGVTSQVQVSADQAEMNANLSTISRTADTTKYSDQFLLNGAKGISYGTQDPGGLVNVGATQVNEIPDQAGQSVSVQFAGGAANQAEKAHLESQFGGGTTLAASQQFAVTGSSGSKDFSFAAGTSIADMAATINQSSGQTGVTAYAIQGGSELRLTSSQYGADQFVRVEQSAGSAFAASGSRAEDQGQNATLSVGGQQAQTQGLALTVDAQGFSGRIALNEGAPAATTVAQTGYDQDTLTDATTSRTANLQSFQGGMRFQLGETAGSQSRTVFGMNSMSLSNLGRVNVDGQNLSLSDLMSGGRASLANDPEAAIRVIDQAIADVSGQRARIGAYQANTLQSNANSLSVALENITATESGIRDADMAEEMTNFVRDQILSRTGLLGVQAANMNAKNVMTLLGG